MKKIRFESLSRSYARAEAAFQRGVAGGLQIDFRARIDMRRDDKCFVSKWLYLVANRCCKPTFLRFGQVSAAQWTGI